MTEALRWMRDWALLGGITCAIAPVSAVLLGAAPEAFLPLAVALGTASGGAVGLAMRAMLARAPERSWVALAAVVWTPVLGGWGAVVSAAAANFVVPELNRAAVLCGAIAALLQTLWFSPAYALQARRQGRRWPLLAGAVPVAVLAGTAATIAGIIAVAFFGFLPFPLVTP